MEDANVDEARPGAKLAHPDIASTNGPNWFCLPPYANRACERQTERGRERERAGARERRADRGKAEEGGSESGREGRRILEMVQAFEQQRGKAVEASTDFFVASVPRGPLPGSSS